MVEVKGDVAIDNLTEEQAKEIFELFGCRASGSAKRLFGGFASSNFVVVGTEHDATGEASEKTLLLKISHYSIPLEDLQRQIFVMNKLKEGGFPTNYPHAARGSGNFLVEALGRRAMLLDFIGGSVQGDKLLEREPEAASSMLQEMGRTFAQLHQVAWPEDHPVASVRSGYPVCGMGEILKWGDEELRELRASAADAAVAEHPVTTFVEECVPWARALFDSDIPWGFIHGDGFLDNILFEDKPSEDGHHKLLALIDWEDCCMGPKVLDLAVSASACCFNAQNELLGDRLSVLLSTYHASRPLSALERKLLPDFMAIGALACAYYRYTEFNVRKPDSNPQAKETWKLQFERARNLRTEGSKERSCVEALSSGLA